VPRMQAVPFVCVPCRHPSGALIYIIYCIGRAQAGSASPAYAIRLYPRACQLVEARSLLCCRPGLSAHACMPALIALSLPSLALPPRLRDRLVQNGQQGRGASGSILSRGAQELGGHVLPCLCREYARYGRAARPKRMAGYPRQAEADRGSGSLRHDLALREASVRPSCRPACIGLALGHWVLTKLKHELHGLPVISSKILGESPNVELHAVGDNTADVIKFPLLDRPWLCVHLTDRQTAI
jgi:hypothetical protein